MFVGCRRPVQGAGELSRRRGGWKSVHRVRLGRLASQRLQRAAGRPCRQTSRLQQYASTTLPRLPQHSFTGKLFFEVYAIKQGEIEAFSMFFETTVFMCAMNMGVRHGGAGETSPENLEWGR